MRPDSKGSVQRGRWTGPSAPKVIKVLRFDGPCGPEGYGGGCAADFIGRLTAREALINSLSDFILEFLFNARNKLTRIASYLRRLMRSIG